MPFDHATVLWPDLAESFFRDRSFVAVRQEGPHCVSTSLAILTGQPPERFQGVVNTQNPVSWSDSLGPWSMKLAYCPTDARKLGFYMDELLAYDDLFVLCYYIPVDAHAILADPDERGWVCGSHIVVLHRSLILDPASGTATEAMRHTCNARHTKRIFRVVPAEYRRGL